MKERTKARVERSAGDVPMEPRNEEQMTDRHVIASGEEEKQHEENIMRDISTFVHEDRRQQMKNNLTISGRHDDPSRTLQIHRRLQPCMCLVCVLRVVRNKIGRSPYLCTTQVMLTMAYKFLRWTCPTRWMDEGVETKEVHDWYGEVN